MTLFEWLRDILRRAASIGRFWYSLREKRTIVDVFFEDKSVAAVTPAQAQIEHESDTMARRFVKIYEPLRLHLFDDQTTGSLSDANDAKGLIRFDTVSEPSETESELDAPNDDGPSF